MYRYTDYGWNYFSTFYVRLYFMNTNLGMKVMNTVYIYLSSLCKELKVITERALSTPGDTLQLMEHKAYMEDVMENQLHSLENRVWDLHTQLQVSLHFFCLCSFAYFLSLGIY